MGKTAWIAGTAALGLATGMASTPVQAQWGGGYYVAPSPYVQHAPPPQRVWVPGHWVWDGYRHVWVAGHYQVVQPVYGRPYGHARRDQDGDGIPNRYDRDRDGDGVPNRFDHRPNNPWRR